MMKEICAIAQLHFNNYEVDDMEEYVCQTARDIQEVGLNNAVDYRAMNVNMLEQFSQLT